MLEEPETKETPTRRLNLRFLSFVSPFPRLHREPTRVIRTTSIVPSCRILVVFLEEGLSAGVVLGCLQESTHHPLQPVDVRWRVLFQLHSFSLTPGKYSKVKLDLEFGETKPQTYILQF